MNNRDQKPALDCGPRVTPAWSAAAALLLALGCGDRSPVWDAPVGRAHAFALDDAVAVVDPDADRVVLLTTDVARRAHFEAVPIQRGMRAATVAPDRSRLFVVSAGDAGGMPPGGELEQGPALEIVTTSAAGRRAYPLSEPLDGLALDPRGEWAVLFASTSSGGLVNNPNELLLVDLDRPAGAGGTPNPIAHTLRSFGGKPQRFTFTDTLELPGGARRLLIVETEQDVAIVDLSRPADPEITVQLTSGQDTRRVHPAAVVVSDGDAGPNDARIAIRTDDRNVMIATLLPATDRDFSPSLNLTDVGAVPSDAAWVRTDAGALGLAALVPGAGKAVVIDPTTGLTVDVGLPAAYQRLSLVTAVATKTGTSAGAGASPGTVGGAGATVPPVDVALLWNANAGGVAFWELGRVAGQPYRSVETVGVTSAVTSVIDVGSAHPELKILQTKDTAFFVLDLKARTSAPFQTSTSSLVISPSATGTRAWAYVPGSSQIASIDLQTLHATERRTERPLSSLFEITSSAAAPGASAGRSLVALTQQGTWAAAIYDATSAGDANDAAGDVHTDVAGILLEGIDAF